MKSNYWQKHVYVFTHISRLILAKKAFKEFDLSFLIFFFRLNSLETGPPTRDQPQPAGNDGWRKVTLTVPNGKISHENGMGETPIAPPRRKRSSIVDRQPCGFKELFGNNVSRRSSCDSILKDDNQLSDKEREILSQKRKSKSISDFNLNENRSSIDGLTISTIRIPVTRTLSMMEGAMVQQTANPVSRPILQRKVSKVGNKKSDKFFGENLSDCLSDDPITPEPEPTSISFTYHTISTLITPIPHTTAESKDKLDDLVNSNTPANAIDSNKTGNAEVINATASITIKPFIISDQVDAKQAINDDKKSSLDKKAEFLMAMLEGNAPYKAVDETTVVTPPRRSHLKKRISQQTSATEMTGNGIDAKNNDEAVVGKKTIVDNKEVAVNVNTINVDDYYTEMNAIVEPPIVPRKRSIKHICDDDHHLQKHIGHKHPSPNHNENKENQPKASIKDEDIEKYIIKQVVNSPEKPKRDFTIYEKSMQNVIDKSMAVPPTNGEPKTIKQLPRVRHLSQENLMSKKFVSSKSNDTLDLLRIKSLGNDENTINITNEVNAGNRLESILKKYGSQQSFFTKEILSQIADRVYGFQDPFETLGHCDDGSSKCTPNSKLTTRKISAHRKESTVTRPIFENVENEVDASPTFDNTPKIVQANAKEQQPLNSSPNSNKMEKLADNKTIASHKMNGINVFDENLTFPTNDKIEQIKCDTENFLTIERNGSMMCDKIQPNQNGLNANTKPDRIIACAVAANHILDDIYKVNSTILNEFQKNFNDSAATDGQTETIHSSDDENTGSDITVKEVPVIEPETELIVENQLLQLLNGGEKRASIVEVDAWFLKHNDDLSNLPRRGSESNSTGYGYDTRKVFPFGRSDPGAGSEFFESKTLSKSAEHIVNNGKLTTKVEITSQANENPSETPSTDHSILLKYLK